jgi:DtxR family Mn-dependent transcriptional regulator
MPQRSTHGNALTAAMEDYLEAIYHIVQEHGYAKSGQIAERLGVHKSTVTTALHFLQTQGYIEYAPYQDAKLTEKGTTEAEDVVRRHDIFYRLLHQLLGVEEAEASALACELEHSLSPDIADKFIKLVEKALKKIK